MMIKNIIMIVIALVIIIVTVGWAMNEIKLINVKRYSNLEILDFQSQIEKDGHVSKKNALKLASIKDRDYIRIYGLSNVTIELESNNDKEKYWQVTFIYGDNQENYLHCGVYKIDYYTGEEITRAKDDLLSPNDSGHTSIIVN